MDFELKECQKYRPDHTMYLLISIDANLCLNTVNYKNTKKVQCIKSRYNKAPIVYPKLQSKWGKNCTLFLDFFPLCIRAYAAAVDLSSASTNMLP